MEAMLESEVNIMLLGSTGSGKSASGNTILSRARDPFEDDCSPSSVTRTCESAETEVNGQTITVIDTVGISDTSVKITDAQTQIKRMLTLHSVDVFLLVIKLGETFTKSDSKVVKWIWNNFGAKFSKHTIVLFTHGDQLHGPVEKYLDKCKTLRSYVGQCSGGFHVFNNKKEDRFQVKELQKEINKLRRKNGNRRYTEHDYAVAQKDLQLLRCVIGVVLGAAVGGLIGAALIVAALIVAVGGPVLALIGGSAVLGAAAGAVYLLSEKGFNLMTRYLFQAQMGNVYD